MSIPRLPIECTRCHAQLQGQLDTFGAVGEECCAKCWYTAPAIDSAFQDLNAKIEEAREELSDMRHELDQLDEDDFDTQREFEYEVAEMQGDIEYLENQLYNLQDDLRAHVASEKRKTEQMLSKWKQLAGVA
jgi:predicted RNase H-like nuclease (RuvC/YqgF family)